MKCKHNKGGTSTYLDLTRKPTIIVHCNICDLCGEWLPLGPANDSIGVELRAAVLAAAWTPDGVTIPYTVDEARGWDGWPYRQPTNAGQWAGFLAAQIQNHERDLDGANWAGAHMADYPVETPSKVTP